MILSIRRGVLAVAVAVSMTAAACGDDAGPGPQTTAPPVGTPVDVVASFYPLQFVAERVGGEYVTVSNLTPPGAEPHDLELAAADLAHLSNSKVVLYLKGFTPAVDDAVKSVSADQAFDVSTNINFNLPRVDGDNNVDPHFWLDPTRLADVADAVAERFATIRPDAAATFRANAAALRADLLALDAEFTKGLTTCATRDLVTSHTAFSYLAARYQLTQFGITGLSPDAEPTPAALAQVADYITANKVTTVYTETLLSPDVAQTLASETGAKVAVLDPLEGLAANATGDYLSIMRTNLATLVAGQGCA